MKNKKSFKFNERARFFNGWITRVDSEMLLATFHLYLRVLKIKNSKFDKLEADSRKLALVYRNLKINDLIYFLCRLMIHFISGSNYEISVCKKNYNKWVRDEFGSFCEKTYLQELIGLFDCEDFEKLDYIPVNIDEFNNYVH